MSKFRPILKVLALVLIGIGLTSYAYSLFLWDDYSKSLPHRPMPLSGRIYGLNIHGIVVYQSLEEKRKREFCKHFGMTLFFGGLLVGGLSQGSSTENAMLRR